MSRLTIAGAACAVWLAASPAAADPFQNFVDMCLRSDANAQTARDAANAAGWAKLPTTELGGDMPFEGVEVYFTGDEPSGDKPAVFEFLMTGWQSGEEALEVEGVHLDVCAIGFGATGDDEMVDAMENHVGFAPVEFEGKLTWMFSRDGNALRSENEILTSDLDARLDAFRRRKLLMAGVWNEGEMTLLVVGASRPMR